MNDTNNYETMNRQELINKCYRFETEIECYRLGLMPVKKEVTFSSFGNALIVVGIMYIIFGLFIKAI